MPRIELRVRFKDRDRARHLGARWDRVKRAWFVPQGASPAPFRRWIPKAPEINYRCSDHYFIATYPEQCWKCHELIWVYGIALPNDHERFSVGLDAEADHPNVLAWRRVATPAFLHYIDYLPGEVQEQVRALTSHYRIDYSDMTQSWYWMNHCEYCGAKHGDFRLFCEPGGFMPMTQDHASVVQLHRIVAPFAAHADGYSHVDGFFDSMQEE